MYVKPNIMGRSLNYCSNENIRMRYPCSAQLRIGANNIKIFSVGQQCLYS